MAIFKMVSPRAGIAFKIGATFKTGSEQIKEQTKSQGKKQERYFRGQDVGIAVYVAKHQGGVTFTYENKSSQYRLIEKVNFSLQGCRIEGLRGSRIKVTLEPGETSILNIVPWRAGQGYQIGMSSIRYAVVPARWQWSPF